MFDVSNLWLFVGSVVLLSVTPGPDMAYVVGQSLANGRLAGVISAAGVALGSLTHALASAIGLTALIAASPLLFSIVKYAGAAYLIYLGARMLVSTLGRRVETLDAPRVARGATSRQLLAKGYITTLTNPKVILFFVSFFPQFIVLGGDRQMESFVLLGLIYALLGFCIDATLALLAGGAATAVSKSALAQRLLDRVVGTAFISLGVRLAFTQR